MIEHSNDDLQVKTLWFAVNMTNLHPFVVYISDWVNLS